MERLKGNGKASSPFLKIKSGLFLRLLSAIVNLNTLQSVSWIVWFIYNSNKIFLLSCVDRILSSTNSEIISP
jgi:hypothetical protein